MLALLIEIVEDINSVVYAMFNSKVTLMVSSGYLKEEFLLS